MRTSLISAVRNIFAHLANGLQEWFPLNIADSTTNFHNNHICIRTTSYSLHTLFNLVGLKATAQSVKPTFAGGEVSLPVEIVNQSTGARHGIELSLRIRQDTACDYF